MSHQRVTATYDIHGSATEAAPLHGRATRNFLLPVLLALAALTLLPGGALAQSALTDDASVSMLTANSNHGADPNLTISSAQNVYLKFKLSSTAAGTSGPEIAKAALKLYVGKVDTAGKLDVYAVAGAWDESTITAQNAPHLGGLVTTTAQIGTDQKGKFLVIDITSLVQQWLGNDGQGTNGMPNNGLALVAHWTDATTPEVADITFDSKENSQTSHEAQLNIQLTRGNGLQRVERDATLIGDGTAALPLGVAAGAINTVHLANGAVTGAKIASGAVGSTQLANGAVTSEKITAPLSLTSADGGATLSVANTGAGAAITANAAINTTTQYNIGGQRVFSVADGSMFGGNTLAGINAGSVNTGSGNSFFGWGAGRSNTTGFGNSFFGLGAGFSNSTASGNSFFGDGAGVSNTASLNSFFGSGAGNQNTTGSSNSFFGWAAGGVNTTGGNNSFFGWAAGVSNSTGGNNSFFGERSGLSNTTGGFNSFFGSAAGENNTTGGFNSFFGHLAGSNNSTGTNNAFFGDGAGQSNTEGNDNTFSGGNAGVSNTTGSKNSFFGVESGQSTTTGNSNAFFGFKTGDSNTTGTSNSFLGSFAGLSNTTGNGNSFLGSFAGASNTTGQSNVFIGSNTGQNNTTEFLNTFVGYGASGAAGVTNATAIGENAVVTQNNSLVLGSNGVKVGIGVSAPKTRLHVTGGKIYVEANGQGVVMKSPGGACFELTVTNAGALTTAAVACP